MSREAEIKFADYSRQLVQLIVNSISDWSQITVKDFLGFKQLQEPGKRSTDYAISIHGRQETFVLGFKCQQSNDQTVIEITIGHTNEWNPVLSVASNNHDPVSLNCSGDAGADALEIKKQVASMLE